MGERGKRSWTIWADEYETEEEFRDAVARELAAVENIGHRLGGAFISAPIRKATEVRGLEEYETTGWHFEHTFMPAARTQQPPEAEPELTADELAEHFPDAEPVGA